MSTPQLITPEYVEQNRMLHSERPDYGTSGERYADLIQDLAHRIGAEEILDYGCGKNTLANALPQFTVHGYDPCIEGLEAAPEPHDLVVCTDVLEHIEPELLDNVLADLVRVTRGTLFLEVATSPAMKTLPDGRNAHLIVKHRNWWLGKLIPLFDIDKFINDVGEDLGFIATLRARRAA